jgi:1-deoxyxylulose-5-phosphate synthase
VATGVGLIPWSPLARGLLAGSRDRGGARHTVRAGSDGFMDSLYTEADFDVVEAVRAVADERGVPAAQVALAWLLGRPVVSAPIIGATKLAHVDDAVAAVDLALGEEEVARLEAPYRPHPVLGHS